jgi:glycosyl-4,4'-diaponeurosporenoate acyltransferase
MVIHLSGLLMLLLDFIAWLLINLSVAGVISRLRSESFNAETWLFKERNWEKQSRLYERLLKIKKWKSWLPDGAEVSRKAFKKKHLQTADPAYIQVFILETCRAEILHWIIFLLGFVFFIWNPWYVGIIMIVYAGITNLPCILTQRYNRIRLKRFLLARIAQEKHETAFNSEYPGHAIFPHLQNRQL